MTAHKSFSQCHVAMMRSEFAKYQSGLIKNVTVHLFGFKVYVLDNMESAILS